jgi:hypothetical protein
MMAELYPPTDVSARAQVSGHIGSGCGAGAEKELAAVLQGG